MKFEYFIVHKLNLLLFKYAKSFVLKI